MSPGIAHAVMSVTSASNRAIMGILLFIWLPPLDEQIRHDVPLGTSYHKNGFLSINPIIFLYIVNNSFTHAHANRLFLRFFVLDCAKTVAFAACLW